MLHGVGKRLGLTSKVIWRSISCADGLTHVLQGWLAKTKGCLGSPRLDIAQCLVPQITDQPDQEERQTRTMVLREVSERRDGHGIRTVRLSRRTE